MALRSAHLLAGACLLYLATADLILLPSTYVDSQQVTRSKRQSAPSLNVHDFPKTSFSCEGRKLGEYYADPESRCQIYHICLAGSNGILSPMSFACPNGTIFSQASRVCNTYERVYCQISEQFYETLHGDLNIHRQDYGNPNDYKNVRFPNNPRVPLLPNNIDENNRDDDYYEEPAGRVTTTTRPPRRNRPSNNRQNSRPSDRTPPTTVPPPPPPPPQAPQGFRRQSFRPPTTTEQEETTTDQPARSSVARRPAFRAPAFRPNFQTQPDEQSEPELPTPPAQPARSVIPANRNRVAQPPPPSLVLRQPVSPPALVLRQPPPPPSLVLRQPVGPPSGSSPLDRLPPGLRGIARPIAIGEATESAAPAELPPRPSLVRPGPFRPAGIQRPTPAAPPTQPPTTLAPTTTTQEETTQAYEYDYVYDYDIPPQSTGAARSKREANKEYRVSRYPPVVDTSRTPILTDFTCQGKLSGFVYADVQTDCEMFHVCVPVGKGKMFDYRLFCASNTAFNQRLGICEEKENFKCSASEKYYRHDKMGRHFAGQKPVYDKVFRLPRQVEKDLLREERAYPKTSFSCVGKTVGGYYADPDTDCQMFHICAPGLGNHSTDLKFLCSNGTTFNQKTLVCDQEGQVQCKQSEQYYINNHTYLLEQEKRRQEEDKVPINDDKFEILRKTWSEKAI